MIKHILSSLLLFFLIIEGHIVHSETINPYSILIKTINGKTIKLNDFKGKKPVYLKLWATWCQPCREQMPHLQHTYIEYGNKIEVIAVNIGINENVEAITKVIKEFGLTFPVAIDDNSNLSHAINMKATPFHILFDKNGTVVHKGHNVSPELDEKIRILVSQKVSDLSEIQSEVGKALPLKLNLDKNKISLLFFASTWCDWYLKDSRPEMSNNCTAAQHIINNLYEKYPELNWMGVLTRLWTGDKEMKEYQEKYNIKYALAIDNTNTAFIDYGVEDFPTLIGFNNGKEIFRLQDFSNRLLIEAKLKSINAID